MNASLKVELTFGLLILLIMGLYFFTDWFSQTTGYVLGEDEKINLAQCLTENGSNFYVEDKCLDCYRQYELFGKTAFEYISVINCSSSEGLCFGLKEIPAWQINNKFYYGLLDLKQLIELSGCGVSEEEKSSNNK